MPQDGLVRSARNSRRQQLPEEVAAYVRELIVSGEVKPGEFLRMEPIAEAVGVSNTPVREGLLLLRSEGFVKLVPRRGFQVASFTPQDVRDIFWVQAQLAGELAARAAKKITRAQIKELEENIAQYDEALRKHDEDRVAYLGHAFHRAVNLAADSNRLALVLGSVVTQLPNSFYTTIELYATDEGMVASAESTHPAILEALRRRQSRKARSIMEHHILERAEQLASMLDERQSGAAASGS
ncbi:GntR family transcriptional regulator [Saccharomonospora sp. NPDC046836]|uniref:GntR family transcriptional regulator n=1 Tax=Saccharomonospora sp. NPDC046836 TaxID=3156921 RepID=UPI0034119E4F